MIKSGIVAFLEGEKNTKLEKCLLMNFLRSLSTSASSCTLNIKPLFQLMPGKLYFSDSHLHCNQMEHEKHGVILMLQK